MDNKTNIYAEYKPSPLGLIPNDWEVKSMRECCLIKGEYGINASAVQYSENLPTYIRITDIDDDGNYSTFKKASVKDENSEKFLLNKGDIVFARTGATVGKTYLYDERDGKLVFAGFLIRFRPDEKKLLVEHLRNFTQTKPYWDWVKTISMRSGQPGINAEEYGSLKLPLPPLPEQKAIASLLSTWDAAIQNNAQLIAQKELYKKWLMQQLLTGKKRLKGFSGEWKEVHIKDISKEVSMRNKTDKQLTVLSCTKYDGLVHSLEYWGRKIFSDDISTYKIVPKNHFAYATNHIEEGSIGYQNILDEALISPMYTVFKTDSSVNDDFFYKLLKSHKLIYQYQNRMEGSIDRRGGLRWDAFSIIKIKLPKIEEQTAITKVLQASDKEIQLLKAKTDKLKEQKKGLMQVLLNGKKRLKIK
ncbi:MAG: restriction endonuclease subunit S [Bacteroidetes bacterium]|nr:restriction endonuclease subunit S [Bacteroidota bacterium]